MILSERIVESKDRRVTPRRSPVIAVTLGDPCGIGPEVLLKALARPSRSLSRRLVVIGTLRVVQHTARRLRLPMPDWDVVGADEDRESRSPLVFVDVPARAECVPGRSSARAGRTALAYLDHAIALWRSGRVQRLVTGPVTKWAVQRVSPAFVGQTEYLAKATGVSRVAMMFVSPRFRMVLLTRHLPLAAVPRALSRRLVRHTLELTAEALVHRFRVRHPRVAVCGLNPHAGEGGLFGREERTILGPVLDSLRARGMRLEGPLASDGLFPAAHQYDAIVCCYHDQALIPFKLLARDDGCQLSLGLPIVRTSPDHGSALDIAGRGVAHPGSMRYALHLATHLIL
jgi:4-hydroxythreonine-4-phosphate dehydrogenase